MFDFDLILILVREVSRLPNLPLAPRSTVSENLSITFRLPSGKWKIFAHSFYLNAELKLRLKPVPLCCCHHDDDTIHVTLFFRHLLALVQTDFLSLIGFRNYRKRVSNESI